MKKILFIISLLIFTQYKSFSQVDSLNSKTIINDVTTLNPVFVQKIYTATNTNELAEVVKNHSGKISIGGGKFSMGGQTSFENSLHIDMSKFDSILTFSQEKKEITVQTGITWRKLQEFIDPYNLSVSIMQTYANFTVGGSLGVNVHGRYIGKGPIILSVKNIKILLADGTIVKASPTENSNIFYGAIGGYGSLGIITEATLILADNVKVEETDTVFSIKNYTEYFTQHVRNDTNTIFHNGDIYPNKYKHVRAVSYKKTNKEVTEKQRLRPIKSKYKFNQIAIKIISDFPAGKWMREHLIDPCLYKKEKVFWRNYEASHDVLELEPKSRKKYTYVLQEYFVPVSEFDEFSKQMFQILQENNVNVLNISIRHAHKDPGSTLAWANTEVFAFVIYYKQKKGKEEQAKVQNWTQQLIQTAIDNKGTYYLPYQLNASNEQFNKAYPSNEQLISLKKLLDPTNKFKSKFIEKYLIK